MLSLFSAFPHKLSVAGNGCRKYIAGTEKLMLQLVIEILVSIFFIFGVYCALVELWNLFMRFWEQRHQREIDNGAENTYNNHYYNH